MTSVLLALAAGASRALDLWEERLGLPRSLAHWLILTVLIASGAAVILVLAALVAVRVGLADR